MQFFVKGVIIVESANDAIKIIKNLIFKDNAPFRSCKSKINSTFIDNAEDLDIVIPIYNLLEYSVNDSMTSGSLRNYHRDEVNVDADEIAANYRTNSNKITKSRSFEYKTKILRREPINNKILNAEVAVPFKYLSNFCGSQVSNS